MLFRKTPQMILFLVFFLFAHLEEAIAADQTRRIVGGTSVSTSYSWMVAIGKTANISTVDGSIPFEQFCGGSLIHEKWVLTAAHCLVDDEHNLKDKTNIRVLLGSNTLKIKSLSGDVELLEVENIIVHPTYLKGSIHDYDIGIIELKQKSHKKPINLIERYDGLAGTLFTLGWGRVGEETTTTELQISTGQRLIPNSDCKVMLDVLGGLITNNMLCVIHEESSTCKGDSGSPLVIKNSQGEFIQIGITSWSPSKCEKNNIDVFANVQSLLDFIKDRVPAPVGCIFADIPQSSADYNVINYLCKNDIINGYSDGYARLDNKIKRAEFVKMFIQSLKIPEIINIIGQFKIPSSCSTLKTNPFSDVKISDWFCDVVNIAKYNGLIKGYSNGEFGFNNNIKKSEAAKIIALSFFNGQIAFPKDSTFKKCTQDLGYDIKSTDWFCQYIQELVNRNVINNDFFFFPNSDVTREQIARMIYNSIQKITQ